MDELKMDTPSPEMVKGLAKFREQLAQPEKSREVDTGKYKYSYATLNDVIKAIDTAIKGTGLSYVQVQEVDPRTVTVRTVIMCEGDRMDTGIVQMASSGNPQAVGSAITYARRYSLSTAFGIAPDEDDDGRAAEASFNQGYQQNNTSNRQDNRSNQHNYQNASNNRHQSKNTGGQAQQPSARQKLTNDINAFRALEQRFAREQGMDIKQINRAVFESANILKKWEDLSREDLSELMNQFTIFAKSIRSIPIDKSIPTESRGDESAQ